MARGGHWPVMPDTTATRSPVTGHGINGAFRDAELLADALDDIIRGKDHERSALADYHAMRDSQLRLIAA